MGQLVLITEDIFKILVEKGSHTLSHDLDYDSLERVADRFLGETVGFNVVNGKITKMKPLWSGHPSIEKPDRLLDVEAVEMEVSVSTS